MAGTTFKVKVNGLYEVINENNRKVVALPRQGDSYSTTELLRFIKDATPAEQGTYRELPANTIFSTEANAAETLSVRGGGATDVRVDPNSEVRPSGRPVVEKDPSKFLDTMSKNTILDISDTAFKPKVVAEPGMLSQEVANKVNAELKVLCQKLLGANDPQTLTNFVLLILQMAATFYTSRSSEHKEFDYLETPDGKRIYVEEVFNTIKHACVSTGYENPVRQYLAWFTPTIVTAMLNGKLTPNEKVMAQHGVPPKFFAYTLDCVRPSYNLFNNSAILAWNLARREAFKSKSTSSDNTLHNVYQMLGK